MHIELFRLPFCFCSMPYVGRLLGSMLRCHYVWLPEAPAFRRKWNERKILLLLLSEEKTREKSFRNLKTIFLFFASLMNRNIFHKLFKRKITFLFDLLFSWFRQLAANYLWADFLFCLVAGGTKNENSVSRQNVVAPNFSFSLRQVLIKIVSRNVEQIADSSINLRFSLRLVEASSTRARSVTL